MMDTYGFESLTARLNSAGQRVERGVDWHPLLQSEVRRFYWVSFGVGSER